MFPTVIVAAAPAPRIPDHQLLQLRQVSIVEVLATEFHHQPTHHHGTSTWYTSPLRDPEHTPSFKVDVALNLWYDHGLGRGGDVLDLVQELGKCSFTEAVALLQPYAASAPAVVAQPRRPGEAKESPFYDFQLGPLRDEYLLQYLIGRGINAWALLQTNPVLGDFLQQATYRTKGKLPTYRSVIWLNHAGGWDMKGPMPKGGAFTAKHGPQSYTLVPGTGTKTNGLIIVEGFCDYLALLMDLRKPATEADVLVLNSGKYVGQAQELIGAYPKLHYFGDNDNTGNQVHAFLTAHHPQIIDERGRYANYKDLNDLLLDITLAQRDAERQAAKAAAIPVNPTVAPQELRDTARWWLAVKWAPGMAQADENGEVKQWGTFYAWTNELTGLNDLKKLRSRYVQEKRVVVTRLCERQPGQNSLGKSNYKVLEQQQH